MNAECYLDAAKRCQKKNPTIAVIEIDVFYKRENNQTEIIVNKQKLLISRNRQWNPHKNASVDMCLQSFSKNMFLFSDVQWFLLICPGKATPSNPCQATNKKPMYIPRNSQYNPHTNLFRTYVHCLLNDVNNHLRHPCQESDLQQGLSNMCVWWYIV